MKFPQPLLSGRFIRRYKRFFADVVLEDGRVVTAHCPNTGSMLNCLVPDSPCWVAPVTSPKAKLKYRLELVTSLYCGLAGINTLRANGLVGEALEEDRIAQLTGYQSFRSEVKYGMENSRIDWLLEGPSGKCYLEVKNVTLGEEGGRALFPDAVTSRGQRHLRELAEICRQGHRAVLFFCVQLEEASSVAVADQIDPAYAAELRGALFAGVEVLAYSASITPDAIVLSQKLPFVQGS